MAATEQTTLLPGNTLNRSQFRCLAVCLFVFLISVLSLGLYLTAIVANGLVFVVLGWILVACVGIFLVMTLHGYYIWQRGDLPIPQSEREGARYVTTWDGKRQIEYFVWGSTAPNAIVTLVCHGSSTTGKHFNQYLYPDAVMKEMNVKVISPSYPGHGGSDSQPHRRIKDWPLFDVEPILDQEGVGRFMVQGSSYGTAHAMSTAAHFGRRCIALGLNVPYLPQPICRELFYHTDADYILSEEPLSRPWNLLPTLSILWTTQGIVSRAISLLPEGKQARAQKMGVLEVLERDCRRSFLRGVIGQCYEMLNADTNQYWPDPRTTIKTPVVAVWWAKDDSACPSVHGDWLAGIFQRNNGMVTNIRSEDVGLGHFTYMTDCDRNNGIMTRILLEMLHEP